MGRVRYCPAVSWLYLILAAPMPSVAEPIRLGSTMVVPDARELIATGRVNQVDGLIEYLACGPKGKLHESTLVLNLDALDLQAGLILLGLRPGTRPRAQGDGPPAGPEVELWIEWTDGGAQRAVRAEHTIYSRRTDAVLPQTGWVFSGSEAEDGELLASVFDLLIATHWDPYSVLNLSLPVGADDTALSAHAPALPPIGTSVRLRVKVPPPGDPAAVEGNDGGRQTH